jgi:TonB family protein
MMPPALLFSNFAAWTAQIGVLVAIGAIAALTLAPGRARLVFWQVLLAVAMLLPAIQPWMQPAEDGSATTSTTVLAIRPAVPHGTSLAFRKEDLLWIVAIGAAARGLWIGIGFLRLRRHRLAARPLTSPPVPFENLGIRWYVSDTISGPVTFGWLRPSILLPSRVCDLPADLREAIACHELVHVRRGDWLFVLVEEAIRGIFWFHPAVWFALSRIQLAREQAVDFEVVRLMGNRERYLDALVAVAAQKFERAFPRVGYRGSDVAPAPLFLKQRQLAVRVAAVLKEKSMSKSRSFAGFATVSSAALIAARLAVWFFPLESPAQTPQSAPAAIRAVSPDGPGIEVDPGAPVMHRMGVGRPFGVKTTGTIVLDATVSPKGEVTDARVISGPDELRRYVLQSVLQWHYSTDGGLAPTVRVVVNFGEAPAPVQSSGGSVVSVSATRSSASDTPTVLKDIQISGASPELAQKVTAALPVHIGDSIHPETMGEILTAAREIDEHFTGTMVSSNSSGVREATLRLMVPGSGPMPQLANERVLPGVPGGVAGGVVGGVPGGVAGAGQRIVAYRDGAPVIQPDTAAPSAPQRIRVGGNVQQANLITKVNPVYPPDAKMARIQGVVTLTAVIGREGSVENIEVISGHPLLVPAATDAVKQWVYKPTLLNGNPVEVITQIDVNFTLVQ